MPSPFPGMDPYLEANWGDIHQRLVTYVCDALQPALPDGLRARMEERVVVDSPAAVRPIHPDVRVLEQKPARRGRKAPSNGSVALLAEPLIVEMDCEDAVENFVEIRDAASGHKLVTVIEVLSLSNKLPGPSRDKYLQKRDELRLSRVNLVEIDLLRAGPRPFPFHADLLPADHRTPYHAWVARGTAAGKSEVYRIPLAERLPVLRIPLRPNDKDVPLDLQMLIEQCYQNGAYDKDLDYQRDPDPPLAGPDQRWADALLRRAGRRKPRRGNSKRKQNGAR